MRIYKVPINCDSEVKYLDTIIKNRLRTQNRDGSVAGNLYFYPSVISIILNAYEKGTNRRAFDNWLNASLESVYFELVSGKIVPLEMVKEVNLIYVDETLSFGQYPTENGKALLKNTKVCFPLLTQKEARKYKVCINYADKDSEQVYVGTKDNLVNGISDLTIDHVQPIKETLEKNIFDLPCIHGIDEIIRASGYITKEKICKEIPQYIKLDEESYLELIKELNLILRETRGLRMVASSVN